MEEHSVHESALQKLLATIFHQNQECIPVTMVTIKLSRVTTFYVFIDQWDNQIEQKKP
jgi:hypothetical protein